MFIGLAIRNLVASSGVCHGYDQREIAHGTGNIFCSVIDRYTLPHPFFTPSDFTIILTLSAILMFYTLKYCHLRYVIQQNDKLLGRTTSY